MEQKPLFQIEGTWYCQEIIRLICRSLLGAALYGASSAALFRSKELPYDWTQLSTEIVTVEPPLEKRISGSIDKIPNNKQTILILNSSRKIVVI